MSAQYFQFLMILGILLGNALAVIIPYLRKLDEGKITAFDIKYLKHAVASALWQNIITLPLWMDWSTPEGFSVVLSFILAVAFGFGGKDFQEQIIKYVRKTPIVPVTPPKV